MSAESSATRILIVHADAGAAQKMGLALDDAGFQVGWSSFAPTEVTGVLRDLKPTLLLVQAELASPQLSTLIARLESAGMANLPMVLVCKDTSDEVFTRPLKSGVVEMLAEPFSARAHVARIRVLLGELSERTGRLRGLGAPNELAAMLHHVMRTRRSGGIIVGDTEEGRAFFVRGVLKSARYQQQTMQAALAAMSRAQTPWTFVEGVEGNAEVIDFTSGDEPYVVARGATPPPMTSPVVRDEDERFSSSFVSGTPAASVPASVPPPPPAIDPETARTSLLFVDDDAAVVHMLSTFFTKKGYTVVTAVDGVDAMARLVARPFDAVIADLNMPRLDGWGLLRLVREDFRTHEVPIALFSAQDNYRESLRLLHAGAQAYFPKTVRLAALEVQVRELLEPRRRFERLISSDGGMSFDFSALGPQWVCRAVSQAGFTGQVDARDSWGTWRLWFDAGRLTQASARIGTTALSGDRALASFLTSKNAEGSLLPGTRAVDEGFAGHSTQSTLDRLIPWVNDEQRRAREDHLAKANALVVNDELYRLYLSVGPPSWLPMVRLLCEAKRPPAEVIAQLKVTPAEVAAVVKDLLRRGVASLQ